MRPDTNFTPLAGPYYARRRNRAEAVTEGLVIVLAYAINAACWLVMQPVRFVAYLLGPKA